ncbi:MAG: glycosyltransferase [Sulfuricaulis sp.]
MMRPTQNDAPGAPARRRVCVVTTSPLIVNFFLGGIIEGLARHFEVSLIVNAEEGTRLKHIPEGVQLLSVRLERKISVIRDLMALGRLLVIFRRERFDAVHSFAPKAGLLAMLAAKMARLPVRIHTFQGEVWAARRGLRRAILKFMDTVTARCTTDALVISRSEREFLIQEGVLEPNRSRVLADGSVCGVELKRFEAATRERATMRARLGVEHNDLVFLYLGRLTKDKGVADLARAFASIAVRFQTAHLLIVGPDEEGLTPVIRRVCSGVEQRVHLYGYSDKPEEFIAAADVVCLPSYREGFGMVLIEAGAVGIPAIASRIYGIADAVSEGDTALLHRPGDIDEIAAHMASLIMNGERRLAMGVRAHAWVTQKFAHERVIGAYLEYYAGLLA